jgi:hypothetical protein
MQRLADSRSRCRWLFGKNADRQVRPMMRGANPKGWLLTIRHLSTTLQRCWANSRMLESTPPRDLGCSEDCVSQHTQPITWNPCLLETSLALPRTQSDPTTTAAVRVVQHPKPLSRVSRPPFRGLLDEKKILRAHQHHRSMG